MAHRNLVYNKDGILNHWAEMDFSVNTVGTLNSHLEKDKIRSIPHTIHKNKLLMNQKYNIKQ